MVRTTTILYKIIFPQIIPESTKAFPYFILESCMYRKHGGTIILSDYLKYLIRFNDFFFFAWLPDLIIELYHILSFFLNRSYVRTMHLRSYRVKAKLSHSRCLGIALNGRAVCSSGVMVGAIYVWAITLSVTTVFEKVISASFNQCQRLRQENS